MLAQQQAASKAMLQKSIRVLGLAPEDLFEGLVQSIEARIRAKYEEKMQTVKKPARLAQASPAEFLALQLHTLPQDNSKSMAIGLSGPVATCVKRNFT